MRSSALLLALLLGCRHDKPPAAMVEDHDAPDVDAPIEDAGIDGPGDDASVPDAAVEPGFFVPGKIGEATPIARPGAPAVRYAAMTQTACEAELGKRAIPFARAAPTVGVRAPVRLKGPVHGVAIHTALPAAMREKSESEIFDCRLVLALDDYVTQVVAKHDVVEMIHFSAYRSAKNGGCTPKYTGKQHCAGLALDVGTYVKRDGTTLDVKRDFGGKIGSGTCEPGMKPQKPGPAQAELWGFVCEAARLGLFNVVLTPNFNAQHENHMHLEVTPDAQWMLIH